MAGILSGGPPLQVDTASSPVERVSSPASHTPLETERKDSASKNALESNETLTEQAMARRAKIQGHISILRTNPDIDDRGSGFIPPTLSFTVRELEAYLSPCLAKAGLCNSCPHFIGGAASHILGMLSYADVDLCYELKYVSVETLKEMVANFILERMLKES
jgi:hypothetical protein